MASDNRIEVIIGANASGFRAGTKEAEEHTESLRSKLIDLKHEHVASARVAKFYAAEIAHIVPGADAARESIQALVNVGLAPTVFAAAAAGVALLVTVFHQLSESVNAQKEEFKKLGDEAEAYATKARKHLLDVIGMLRGETEAERIGSTEVAPLLHNKIMLVDQLREAQEKLKDIESNTDENGLVADIVGLIKAQNEIKKLQTEIGFKQTKFGASVEEAGGINSENAKAAKRKIIEDERNASIQRRTEMLAAENVVATNLWTVATEQMHTDAESLRIKKEEAQADAQAVLDAERLVSPLVSVAEFERVAAEQAAALAEEMRAQEREAKKLQHELGQAARELGDAMGKNLADVLKGTRSIDDALTDMLGTMIKVAAQMAALAAMSAGGPLGFLGAMGITAIGSLAGGIFGGGGGGSSNINVTQNFHGGASPGEHSQAMETMIVNVMRNAQNRGRIT